MAQTKITRSRTIEDKIFDEFKNNAEEANKALLEFLGTQKDVFEQGKKMSQEITFDKDLVKGIQAVEKEQTKLIKNQAVFAKAEKLQLKLEKQLNDASDENVKGKIKLQKVNREQKQLLEAQIILEKKEVKSLKDLKEANKALRIERDRLDIGTQSARIKDLNNQIDSNTDKIKANVDSLSKQKINIGNYKDSVKEALEETGAFDSVLNKLDGTSGKIIGTLNKFIGGLKKQKEATEAAGKAATKTRGSFRKLNTVLKAGIITAVVAALTAMVAAFTQSRKGARELQIITQQVSNSILLFGTRLLVVAGAFGKMMLAFVKISPVALVIKIFGRLRKEIKLFVLELTTFEIPPKFVLGVKVFDGFSIAAEGSKEKIKELREELKEPLDLGITEAFDGLENLIDVTTEAFGDFGDVFITTNARLREQLELQDRLIDQQAILGRQIAILIAEEQQQQQIAGDSTRSFAEQEEAINKVLLIQEKRIDLQQELAELEQKGAILAIKNDLEREGVLKQVSDAQIKNLSFLKDANIADKVSVENLQRLKDATNELIQIEADQIIRALEANKTLIEIRRDRFEQELDFALDVADRQKSINERQIGDERISFNERARLIKDTERLLEDSFDNQIKLTEDFVASTLRLRGKGEIEIAESLEQINLRRLTELTDEAEIRKILIGAGVADEITQNRIREIIIERKSALQDVADLQKDLNKDLFDAEVNLQEFERNLAVTFAEEERERREKDFKEAEFFSSKKLKLILNSIEEEKKAKLAVVELEEDVALQLAQTESEKTKIVKEANEKRRQIDRQTTEDRIELEKQANQRIFESARESIEFLEKINDRRNAKRLKAIDDEISASQKQQDELRQAAKEGTKGAAADLAIAERQEKEAQERRKQELKKQRRDEAKLVFLKILASKAEQGDKNPFLSAVIEFGKTEAFLNSLDSFDKGVDRLGKTDNAVDNKGGRPIVAHEDEMIVEADMNKEMGYPTRDKVLENFHLAERLRAGDFERAHKELTVVNQYQDSTKTLEAFKSLENVIKKNKPPTLKPMFNQYSKVFTEIIKQEGRIDKHRTKIGGGGILGTD